MISQVSEKTMHAFRWVLLIAWLILIFSLFYDPISQYLTDPNNQLSPFRDYIISVANNTALCVKVQSECLKQQPYQMGTRIFWGMIVPSAIMIVFVLGHETWRRICPLYFLSQIPRRLGLEPRLNIENNKWLVENHLYLQFILLFIGLNSRILFINSDRSIFGLFLIFIITSAIAMVYLYGGRSWCHYVCPFGIVQMVFTGPRGLLDSEAHKASPKSITQSMCRYVDQATGKEASACINCKSSCFDIDSEKSYWNHLQKPGRKLVQYGYLGLATGYFIYYFLYSGNFDYYFSGVWSHEENQLSNLFKPGFYILGQTVPIPKLIAVPLTLGFCVRISCLICSKLEKNYRNYIKLKKLSISQDVILHKIFSICTFIAFNVFYIYGGRPEILRLPIPIQFIFNSFVVVVSVLWLYRTWGRSYKEYTKESNVGALRRQLKKLPLDVGQFLKGRSLEEMKPDELEMLVSVLPSVTKQSSNFHQNTELRRKAEALLIQLQVSITQTQVLNYLVYKHQDTIFILLHSRILEKQKFFTIELLKILEILGDEAEIINLAKRVGILAHRVLPIILQDNSTKWQQRLSSQVINLLLTVESQTQLGKTDRRPETVIDVLTQLLQEPDSLTQAAALYALYQFNPQKAYQHSQDLLSKHTLNGLSKYSAEVILGQSPKLLETFSKQLAEAMEK